MIAASCLVSIILVVLKSVPLYAASLNNMVFPEPLTEEEEAVCFEILKKRFNHQNEIEQARNTLIEHNLRLVAHVVKGFNLEPDDDFLNIGYVGLIKAVDTFDFDRGTKLATYAIQCIKNEILMELRKRKKNRAEVSLETPTSLDGEGREQRIMDVVCSDEDSVLDQIERNLLINSIHVNVTRLSELEQKVLEIRYGLTTGIESTQIKTAQILSISRSYVSRIETRAILKLRKLLLSSTLNFKEIDKLAVQIGDFIVIG